MPESGPDPLAHRLSPDEVGELHAVFCSAVSALAPHGDEAPEVWYTWLASRDRINGRFWRRLVTLFRLRHALRTNLPLPPIDDPLLRPLADDLCRRHGGAPAPASGEDDGKRPMPLWKAAAAMVRWRWQALRLPRQTVLHPDVALVSILTRKPLSQEGPYRDTYFGDLHERLEAAGQSVAYAGLVTEDFAGVMAALGARRATHAGPAMTVLAEHFTVADVLRALRRVKRSHLHVPPLMWEGLDLAPLVAADLRDDRATTLHGLVLEQAWPRLQARWPRTRFIQMWENNPWEKALLRVAHATGARCDGYLHTVVIPAHMKYWMTVEEHGHRPMPASIIVAGEGSAQRLCALGAYPDGMVRAGCMLRDTLPDRAPLPPPSGPIRSVLVVLEGLPTMTRLLRFAEDAARRRPDLDFRVRAHPALGIDVLAPMAGVAVGPDHLLKDASGRDYVASLEDVDAVVYQGSMAAVTALYLGRPVIKFVADETVDDDPLAGCPRLHGAAASVDDLFRHLDAFDAMSADAREAATEEVRVFIRALMSPESPQTLVPFLTPAAQDGQDHQPAARKV